MIFRGRLRPGDWAALALLTGGLSVSAGLIAAGYEPTSTCIRTRKLAKATATFLWAHLVFDLPYDPIRYGGDWLDSWVKEARPG